jgi:hypothetical protein
MSNRRKTDSVGTREGDSLHGEVAVERNEGLGVATPPDSGAAPVGDSSWDPYQVWLTRVKRPREQSMRTERREPVVSVPPSPSPDLSDTARMRILTLAP